MKAMFHKPLVTLTMLFKNFHVSTSQPNLPYHSTSCCRSTFFHKTALPDLMAIISNNKEHVAWPKSANTNTQPFPWTSQLSVGLQNTNNTHKFSNNIFCLKFWLSYVPFLAFSSHQIQFWTVLQCHCVMAQNVCLSPPYENRDLAHKRQLRGENL